MASQNNPQGGVLGALGKSASPAAPKSPTTPKSPSFDENRRRSLSGSGGGLFNNLNALKRGSQDESTTARKNSFAEQKAQPGIVGQMWHNWTKK